jgi:hypothetical protein
LHRGSNGIIASSKGVCRKRSTDGLFEFVAVCAGRLIEYVLRYFDDLLASGVGFQANFRGAEVP